MQQFCSLDQQQAQTAVQNLIDQIQGKQQPHVASVAEVMAQAFIGLYQSVINQLKQGLGPGQTSSPQIAQLQSEVQILTQFLKSL